jgi:initiation factor 1A
MVLNKRGGNKTKKQKKFTQENVVNINDGQMFAQIICNNGGRHFSVLCSDNIERMGRICSKMKKGKRLTPGTFVIVSLRSFEAEQRNNCDIIALGNPPIDIMELFQNNVPNNNGNDVIFHTNNNEFDDIGNDNNDETVNFDINSDDAGDSDIDFDNI